MVERLINNAKHWHDRADEARALAEQMTDLAAQRIIYGIAESYQRLAQCAEERLHEEKRAANTGGSSELATLGETSQATNGARTPGGGKPAHPADIV
jgi:hypothetical protein